MVSAVNGHGHGHASNIPTSLSQPSTTEEITEPSQGQSHPGKGKAGAPGQMAKQMLGGTPPAGFSLGNLVSLIAQGDMDGAQNLVNSLTPPSVEEPVTVGEGAEEIQAPDISDIEGTLIEGTEDTAEAIATEETAPIATEDVSLIPESSQETSILDLFDASAEVEEKI